MPDGLTTERATADGVVTSRKCLVRDDPTETTCQNTLRRKIRLLLGIFMAGLALSGATAIPIERELDIVVRLLRQDTGGGGGSPLVLWLWRVDGGLHATYSTYPFMAYGTDWLAFGHFMIALVFVGPLRDPVRNAWVLDFGISACLLLIPYALVFGALRGIPPGWRLIDCSFGILGLLPLVACRRLTRRLSA